MLFCESKSTPHLHTLFMVAKSHWQEYVPQTLSNRGHYFLYFSSCTPPERGFCILVLHQGSLYYNLRTIGLHSVFVKVLLAHCHSHLLITYCLWLLLFCSRVEELWQKPYTLCKPKIFAVLPFIEKVYWPLLYPLTFRSPFHCSFPKTLAFWSLFYLLNTLSSILVFC